jgi:hypothetical protein
MQKQFENTEVTKLINESTPDEAATKRTEDVAKKAAEQALHTEQRYDQDHSIISK